MSSNNAYVGRFAPSPTGPLHFGSLVAALASFLDARHENGKWLLRIEDLDPPRESPSAPGEIVEQLKAFGLLWDGEILFQSARLDAYQSALETLIKQEAVFPCQCARNSFKGIYPGHCRNIDFGDPALGTDPFATRLRVADRVITINDRIAGNVSWNLENDIGDFVVKRRDGLFAYQLAVVVDDINDDVTHIVRGFDLLSSTPRQLLLYDKFKAEVPAYCHIPVILGDDGRKLSKQSHAAPVDHTAPLINLKLALKALGQVVPSKKSSVDQLIQEAIDNWDTEKIPKIQGIPFSSV